MPLTGGGLGLTHQDQSAIIESMNVENDSVEVRARIHAALGDSARLAIVDALTSGDASPGEIGALLGMPTNLVAHHLKVLTEAGVIERTASEADRRRTYVKLRPHTLASLVTPALKPARRVVFVCTRNSARSQLAAALWQTLSVLPVASAGTDPAPKVNPRAVRTAKRHGLQMNPGATSHVDAVIRPEDLIIAVCDHAHETLPATIRRLHWAVPDPVPADTDAAFDAAYEDLADRVSRLGSVLSYEESR